MEEAKDVGIEMAGGGEPPTQPAAGHAKRGLSDLFVRRMQRIGVFADRFVKLNPFPGNADEDGGPVSAHAVEEGLDRGIAQETVFRPPENAPQHFQVAAERMKQWKVTEKNVLVSDLRQRQSPREPLRDQISMRILNALWHAGRAGGVHDGREVVDPNRAGLLLDQRSGDRARPILQIAQIHQAPRDIVERLDRDHVLQIRQGAPVLFDLLQLFASRDHYGADLGMPEDIADIRIGRVGRHDDIDKAGSEAGEIQQRHFDPVLRYDRRSRRRVGVVQRVQAASQRAHTRLDLPPVEALAAAARGKLEEDFGGVGLRPLPEQRAHR